MSEPSVEEDDNPPPVTFYGHTEMTLDTSTPAKKAQKSNHRRGICSNFEGSFLPTEKG